MKKALLFLVLWSVGFCRAQSADRLVDSLLNRPNPKDWFMLDYLQRIESENLSPKMRLRLKALTDARFRRFESSNEALEALSEYQAAAAPEELNEWVTQLFSNYRQSMDYESQLDLYEQIRPKEMASEEDPTYDFMVTLAHAPATHLVRPDESVIIPFRLDSVGKGRLAYVDVVIGGRTEPFVFDTGCAEMSVVSEKFAHEHGIRRIGKSLRMSGGGGEKEGWLGIADSLQVGPMTLYNAIFAVAPELMPDSICRMDAVLGCNFILKTGRFEIHGHDRILRFPAVDEPVVEGPSNMFMENNGLFYIQADVDGNRGFMQFDTGNSDTFLTSAYWSEYGIQLDAMTVEREERRAGLGGALVDRTFVKPVVEMRIDGVPAMFKDVSIYTDRGFSSTFDAGEAGSFGTDFLTAFDCIAIDYERMRVTVGNGATVASGRAMPERVDVGLSSSSRAEKVLWESKNRRAAVVVDTKP